MDGLHSVQLIDAALRSAAEGCWVDVPAPLLYPLAPVPVARSWYFEDQAR